MLPRFLTLAEVLDFHEDLVRSFGGNPEVRDLGLLESALAMPQSGSGTTFFHAFPFHRREQEDRTRCRPSPSLRVSDIEDSHTASRPQFVGHRFRRREARSHVAYHRLPPLPPCMT